ncbi:hypothetical protein KMZ93_19950 [Bradyrhizobium sediminis]|uniref:Uncharacterized protein n=1 Tax=Bradyrhizobium sediminis TaxID=2840469 RepID=A0A975RWL1_9BRAD|nr:hypothetical protein [Bradyrhizobium sediminis]QWG22228.1 hypothetical protein KMZ93_19950 [Bradyrhizobium sediminis]
MRPDTSFGPFRFVEAVPWLMLALTCRIVGPEDKPLLNLLAACGTWVAVLMAFMAVARRVFEIFDRSSHLDALPLDRELRLSLRIFGRIMAVMVAATLLLHNFGNASIAPYFMLGLDSMAFNQSSISGKVWSACMAALVLLLVLGIDRNTGKPSFASTFRGLINQGVRFVAAIVVLAVFYVVLGPIQNVVLNGFWGSSVVAASSHQTKTLIYFTVTLGFAAMRLWATLLILTYGLKQSHLRGAA